MAGATLGARRSVLTTMTGHRVKQAHANHFAVLRERAQRGEEQVDHVAQRAIVTVRTSPINLQTQGHLSVSRLDDRLVQ